MHRALRPPEGKSGGLLREVQQVRLLQHVPEEREVRLIGAQDFADQHQAEE
jgi:hypothetical protein